MNQFGLEYFLNLSRDWGIESKFMVLFANILPMGLLMGMAFPSGIKKIGTVKNEQNLIPLMIGVNGIFSVLGSTLAVVISMLFGFNQTVYIGALIYILLFYYESIKKH